MSNSKFIISLKPLNPFFFGGENTFGEDDVNYFARSNYLPQQTGLLGFLRYELLVQNNLLGTNPKDNNWSTLIGEKSFQRTDSGFTETFGAIKKISPLFLSNGSKHYIPQAMDWALCEDDSVAPLEVKLENIGQALTCNYKGKIPVAMAAGEPYNPKYGLKSLWVSSDGQHLHQWDFDKNFVAGKKYKNGLFIAHSQVGIHRKMEKRRQDTGDFYKQVFYSLDNDLAITFYAELDLPTGKILQSRMVKMGGERSAFAMTVAPAKDSFEDIFTLTTFSFGHHRKEHALVLMSDTYTENDVLTDCDFAITDSVPFRNIKTTQENNGDYARMKGKSGIHTTLEKSTELLYLLKRGSIFYHSDIKSLQSLREKFNYTAFQNIGYNQSFLLTL